jgi:predicted aconitase
MGPTRSTADSTMSALNLTPAEQAMLDGADGSGTALAMRIVVRLAQAMDALSLIPVSGAHIDS